MEAISIISNKTIYTVSLVEKETGSNYNMFANLYKKGEKMPLAGTCFKSTETTDNIITWAKSHIKN